MEAWFILFLIVGVVFVIVATVRAHRRSVNEAWQRAASMLGLRFIPGSLTQSRVLTGELEGIRVTVDTFSKSGGDSSTTYTRYRAYYHEPLGLGLRLEPQGFFTGLKAFFGGQDIEVGDTAFDDGVVVKGANPESVRIFLTPSRRLRILRLFNAPGDSLIEDHRVTRSRKGYAKQANEIAGTMERLAGFAVQLAGAPTPGMDAALEAQRAGRLDEALELVAEAPEREKDADAKLVEGQILATAGRRDEAEAVLRQAHESRPGDEELQAWAESADTQPVAEPLPDVASSPVDTPLPVPTELETPPSEQTTMGEMPEAATVCDALFAKGIMSLETNRLFEERFKGRRVRWTGTVRQVGSYFIDFVFGSDPGTRLAMDLHEVTSGTFGSIVQAIVQLPREAEDELGARIDERLTVEGTLKSCDALARNLYVADARVITI